MKLFGIYLLFAEWTQVAILQLTSSPSESRQKLLVSLVTLCTAVAAGNALSRSYSTRVPQDCGVVAIHKPHMRSCPPHLEQKGSVAAETEVTLSTEQRGVCLSHALICTKTIACPCTCKKEV